MMLGDEHPILTAHATAAAASAPPKASVAAVVAPAPADDATDCTQHAGNRKMLVAVIGLVAILGAATHLMRLVKTPANWQFQGGTSEDVNKRAAARGSITSLTAALTLGLLSTFIDMTSRVDLITSATLMSMVFGNTVGYVMDSSFGSDKGLERATRSVAEALRFGFGSIYSPNFVRYMITVLLDAFISTLLVDRMTFALGFVDGTKRPFSKSLVDCKPSKALLPTAMTIIVGVLTFYAYTNATRFQFAIRDDEFPETPNEFARRASKSKTLATKVHDEPAVKAMLAACTQPDATWEAACGKSRRDVQKFGASTASDDAQTALVMKTLSRELTTPRDYLDTATVLLATLMAGLLYLCTSVNGDKGVHHPSIKVVTVNIALLMMCGLAFTGKMERAPLPQRENDFYIGTAIFAIITFMCIYGTFATSERADKRTAAAVLIGGFVMAALVGSSASAPGADRGVSAVSITLLTVMLFASLGAAMKLRMPCSKTTVAIGTHKAKQPPAPVLAA